jgi:UDP-glucose 4-epimerase
VTWLLTGGAGYIGAHVLRALRDAGLAAVVLDDLSSGDRDRVPADVPFVEASVFDRERVLAELRRHGVRGVVHLAAKKSVPESVARPLHYYEENVGGFAALLSAMGEAGVDRMVLSSSAAVIGTPRDAVVDENVPLRPENAYGRSKLACEWMLADVGAATGLHHATLRYFNVAGAGAPELGDTGESNLVPMIFRALREGRPPQVFGADYPTPDGSCVRDYIHVVDLARAHVAAVRRLVDAGRGRVYAQTFNVGRGEGVSVREMMAVAREVTGLDFAYEVAPRRAGDPASVVGVVDKIEAELGWRAELGVTDMVASAWAAWRERGAAGGSAGG